MENDKNWVSRNEASEILGRHPNSISAIASQHNLAFRVVKFGRTRHRHYRRDEVEALAEKRGLIKRKKTTTSQDKKSTVYAATRADEKLKKALDCASAVLATFGCQQPMETPCC